MRIITAFIAALTLSSCAYFRHAPERTTPADNKPAAPTATAMASNASAPLPSPEGAPVTADTSKSVGAPAAEAAAADSSSSMQITLHPAVPEAAKNAPLPGTQPRKLVPVSRGGKMASEPAAKTDETYEDPLAAADTPTPTTKLVNAQNPVSAEKSLSWLKHGNTRFVKGYLRNDGATMKDRARLVDAQWPHAIILSCSDSRVPPEVVFDQKLGELFVIRTAGEALDDAALGSIEYAIRHMGSHLIVVMGHESCGGVKAALSTLNGSDAGSPALNKLTALLRPHLQSFAGKPVSEGGLAESWANTSGVAKDLVERSQIVRDAVNKGDVKIQTAVYHLGSGVVEFR